jgi:hypothetical protein
MRCGNTAKARPLPAPTGVGYVNYGIWAGPPAKLYFTSIFLYNYEAFLGCIFFLKGDAVSANAAPVASDRLLDEVAAEVLASTDTVHIITGCVMVSGNHDGFTVTATAKAKLIGESMQMLPLYFQMLEGAIRSVDRSVRVTLHLSAYVQSIKLTTGEARQEAGDRHLTFDSLQEYDAWRNSINGWLAGQATLGSWHFEVSCR